MPCDTAQAGLPALPDDLSMLRTNALDKDAAWKRTLAPVCLGWPSEGSVAPVWRFSKTMLSVVALDVLDGPAALIWLSLNYK